MGVQNDDEKVIGDILKDASISYMSKKLDDAKARGQEHEDYDKIKGYLEIISETCRQIEHASAWDGIVNEETINGWLAKIKDAQNSIILAFGKNSAFYCLAIKACVGAIVDRVDEYKQIAQKNVGALFGLAQYEKERENKSSLLEMLEKDMAKRPKEAPDDAERIHEEEVKEVFNKVNEYSGKLEDTVAELKALDKEEPKKDTDKKEKTEVEDAAQTELKAFEKFRSCLDLLKAEYELRGVSKPDDIAMLLVVVERAKADYYAYTVLNPISDSNKLRNKNIELSETDKKRQKIRDKQLKLVADTMEHIKTIKMFPEVKEAYDKARDFHFQLGEIKNSAVEFDTLKKPDRTKRAKTLKDVKVKTEKKEPKKEEKAETKKRSMSTKAKTTEAKTTKRSKNSVETEKAAPERIRETKI